MIAATIVECVFLLILGSGGGLFWLCVGYIGLQVFSNAAEAPLQGLLRDRVPHNQLGVAASIKILLDLLGLVVAGLAVGRMLPASAGQPMPIITLLIGLLLSSAAITIFFTPERPTGEANQQRRANGARRRLRPRVESRIPFSRRRTRLVSPGYLWPAGLWPVLLGRCAPRGRSGEARGDLLASVGGVPSCRCTEHG